MDYGSCEQVVKGWHWCPDGSYVCDTKPSPWATHISRVIGVRVDHEYVGVWSVCILLDAHPNWMTVQAWHAGSSHVAGGVVVADGEQEEAARACAAQIMDDLRAWHGRRR